MAIDRQMLTDALAELAVKLANRPPITEALTNLASSVTAVFGVECAAASLQEAGRYRLLGGTDGRSSALERLQARTQAGPSVEAWRSGTVVNLADIAKAPRRWGGFRSAAREAGIVSVAAVPLRGAGASVGAIGLYGTSRRDWAADDFDAVRVLGDLTTGYVVTAFDLAVQQRVIKQLRDALGTRVIIEQAKGLLAAERGIPVAEAFELLRRYARSRSISIRSVAAAVVGRGFRP